MARFAAVATAILGEKGFDSMSRIDKALNRTTAPMQRSHEDAVDVLVSDLAYPESRRGANPASDAFASPWGFEPAKPEPGNGHRHSGFSVPDASGPGALFQGFARDASEKLVVGQSNEAAMAVSVEQYRKLAGALHNAQIERNIKVVMITSAVAGEGKTLTAINLALTLSESYRRRVLLVDADLRRSALDQIFQVPNISGLSDGLQDNGNRKLSLLAITGQLTLLPAGRPNADPISMLASPRMRRIVEEGSARFDWVILDAPPVGLLTDANLLAGMVDAALIVIQAGKTDYPMVRRAVDAIGRERILGVVLNQVAVGEPGYGYKYDKYYASHRAANDAKPQGDNYI